MYVISNNIFLTNTKQTNLGIILVNILFVYENIISLYCCVNSKEENDNKDFLDEISGNDKNAGNFSFHNSPSGGPNSNSFTPSNLPQNGIDNIFDNQIVRID